MTSERVNGTAPEAGGGDPAERLSVWLDGELDDAAARPVLRQLLGEEDLQRRFGEWCLVGDALRSSEVACGSDPRLCARIARALDEEPALLAPRALPLRLKRNLASGFAVAAAAAVLVLVAVPQLRDSGTASNPQTAGAAPASGGAAPALTVAKTARNPRLEPYLEAHRDLAGPGVMPAAAVYLRSGTEGER